RDRRGTDRPRFRDHRAADGPRPARAQAARPARRDRLRVRGRRGRGGGRGLMAVAAPYRENLRLRAKLELAARERRRIGVFRGIERLRNVRRFAEFAERHLTIVEKEQGVLVPFRLNWIQRAILAAELRARRARRKPRFVVLK